MKGSGLSENWLGKINSDSLSLSVALQAPHNCPRPVQAASFSSRLFIFIWRNWRGCFLFASNTFLKVHTSRFHCSEDFTLNTESLYHILLKYFYILKLGENNPQTDILNESEYSQRMEYFIILEEEADVCGLSGYDIKIFSAFQEYLLRGKHFRHMKCNAKDSSRV